MRVVNIFKKNLKVLKSGHLRNYYWTSKLQNFKYGNYEND